MKADAEEALCLRRMLPSEKEACVRIVRESFGTVATEFRLTQENCPTNGAFWTLAQLEADCEKGKLAFVAEQNGQAVGFFELACFPEQHCVELEKLSVLPAYRHGGIGRRMLQKAAGEARALGAEQLTVGIIEENTVLRQWYSQNGFAHDGTRHFAHLPFTVGMMHQAL